MQNLKNSLWLSSFSHIYIEKDALNHTNTKRILSHFRDAVIIEIGHYKDVFARGHQSFTLQKRSPKLIVAVKKDKLIYQGAEVCQDFGNTHFYYTSSIMNCLYNCEYCYLQGMYPSANIVIFVNIEDYFKEVEKLLNKHPVYLTISYDTDLLALEGITSFVSMWIEFARKHDNLLIELRTKSANFKAIKHIPSSRNVILAWTLSPNKIIDIYEQGTPSLSARLKSALKAIEKGWRVRLCFDPLLYVKGWRELYNQCIEETFKVLPPDKTQDVSIGTFRVSKDYLKKMEKERSDSVLLAYPFVCDNGVCSYEKNHANEMINFVYDSVSKHIPKDKIFV